LGVPFGKHNIIGAFLEELDGLVTIGRFKDLSPADLFERADDVLPRLGSAVRG